MPAAIAPPVVTVSPKQASSFLEAMIRLQRPACLWGSPGIGKSQLVAQTAARLGYEVKEVRAALLDPVDLRGLPHVNGDGRSHWAIPEFLPRDGCPPTVLFFDEVNRAPTLVQNACFQLLDQRRLGEYTLPDNCVVVAACNRETDGGGVMQMPAALANRFVHGHVEPSWQDWCAWAAANDIDPLVLAFIRWQPEYLNKFDPKAKSFPTPRSWHFASDVAKLGLADQDVELALVAGAVGHEAAVAFLAYRRLFRNLPSIDAILLNPKSAPVPAEISTQYAVASALSRRATDRNLGQVITYLERMPTEFNVFAIQTAQQRDSVLAQTPEFVRWAASHPEVFS